METRAARRRRESLAGSPLLQGLLHTHEGRAVWDGRVAPLIGRLGVAALASACTAGRHYRRARVEAGETDLLELGDADYLEPYESIGELRAAFSLGLKLDEHADDVVCRTEYSGTAETLAWLLDVTDVLDYCSDMDWDPVVRSDVERVAKLEVLHQRGFQLHGRLQPLVTTAAEDNFMDALVWLVEHGAPWHWSACLAAVRHGHLEVLRYLRENGCPWDRQQCLDFARIMHYDHVVEWIEQQPA